MTLHDVTYTAHFCDRCIDAAKEHRDEDDKEDGYLVEESNGPDIAKYRSYFLIKWLEAAVGVDGYTPTHECEAPGTCDCSHYHEEEDDEEEDDEDDG